MSFTKWKGISQPQVIPVEKDAVLLHIRGTQRNFYTIVITLDLISQFQGFKILALKFLE